MAKMWAGRFKKEIDDRVNDFNSSISFDCRLYKHDIKGSIAHATMLGCTGIIEKSEAEKIIKGLEEILCDIEEGRLEFDPLAEDIHMFIEAELTKRLGDTGKRLHTARSRNDQVALDVKMYLKEEILEIKELLIKLSNTLMELSQEHADTVMCGYTHLQRAQPITFGHHLMAYVQMLLRDIDRLKSCFERLDTMPLGSCALAGTTYPIDRHQVCKLLGFREPTQNSLDGVSDRDACIEIVFDISMIMTHLSRLSEEIVLWCSWEYRFIELDDAFATGSSIMPQKKNPDITELVRGKTGRVVGDLVTLLTMMKGLALAYNKDMQEDKEATFDAIDTAKLCLETIIPMIATMKVNKENMRNAAAKGFINATDCADYLVKKGLPFRDAYKATGELVAICIDEDKTLETLELSQYKEVCDLFEEDVFEAISLDTCVEERDVLGGPSPKSVMNQIKYAKETLYFYK